MCGNTINQIAVVISQICAAAGYHKGAENNFFFPEELMSRITANSNLTLGIDLTVSEFIADVNMSPYMEIYSLQSVPGGFVAFSIVKLTRITENDVISAMSDLDWDNCSKQAIV